MKTSCINVLLVEDNPGDVRLVQEMLLEVNASEFILSHQDTLHDALERLKRDNIDVMLLDLSLPDVNGLETIKKVLRVASSLPIVVLSGTNDTDLAIEAVQTGAQDYLVKGQGDGNLLTRALRYAIERKRTEERLAYLAQYDSLTGLPNRALFMDRLSAALHHAERHHGLAMLMFLDLDHFKDINDTLGHSAGDELLRHVAKRLHHCVREEDTIARLGGDEFTIIMNDINHREDAGTVAEKILDTMSKPFTLNNKDVFVTTSIGIAEYPSCGINTETLLRNADTALYRAKSEGRSNYQFFETEMNTMVSERMAMTNSLRHAVQQEEFLLYYQPLIEATSGAVLGMEALLRWHHPDRGLLPAKEFIPLLEETNLIITVGEWVLRQACKQNRIWIDAGLTPMCISVNLSVRQFQKQDLVDMVSGILEETHLDPSLLQLEITESVLLDKSNEASETLARLRKLGVRLAIDDFGTGYSSLNYLKDYPFDILKFDRSFIRDMTKSENGAAIVAAVINLGHSVQMSVVAEGVETEQQATLLYNHGCDQYQGYLFGRPMTASACMEWLEEKTLNPMVYRA